MTLYAWLLALLATLYSPALLAGTFINTNGSPDGVAISGFDSVAFFAQ